MSHLRHEGNEPLQRESSEWATADRWLDEALAETFPASDPLSWGREVRMAATETEAAGADRSASPPTSEYQIMTSAVPSGYEAEIQPFNVFVRVPIALAATACKQSVENLNQLLADAMTLRDLYKKHHWQVSGATFSQLHELFDRHHAQQEDAIDAIAERIQSLGGVSLAMAADIAEATRVPRPPKGREVLRVQILRLLHAHELVLHEARTMARLATDYADDGTADLLVSAVIRVNEQQSWQLSQHIVTTLAQAAT
jgi:starvation-inducible DNA-binding protein